MILDAKPLLWATGLLLALGAGLGGMVVTIAGQVSIEAYGGFLAGAGLLWVNLVLGALLVERASAAIANDGPAGLAMSALLMKTVVLFASFGVLGSLLGMVPVVFGAAVTLVCFANAVVFVPLFVRTNPVEAL